jgi:deazaflavin-dependent oxidoreductase (nitroreductase family)
MRKTPLRRVKDGSRYVLVGSVGGAPQHPVWVYDLRANPAVEIRDHTEVSPMRVREVEDAGAVRGVPGEDHPADPALRRGAGG